MLPSLRTVRSRLVASITTLGVLLGTRAIAQAAEGDGSQSQKERPVVFSLETRESPLDRCGGEPALARAVEERLRRVVFTGDDASDRTIVIAPDPETATEASWRARIVERDRAGAELGHREVPLPVLDCAKAVDTLAVVLAIMIGPRRTTTAPPRGQVEPDEPVPSAPPAAPPPRPGDHPPALPARPPPRPEPLRWTASPLVGVAGGTGILPGVSWGIEAGIVVRLPVKPLSAIVRAAYWPAQTTRTQPPADIDRIGGVLLACYELLRFDGLALAGCGGGEVGRVEARSKDLTRASESSVIAGVLGEARLGYRLALGKSAFVEPSLAAQVSAVLRRDRFTFRDPSGRERTLLEPAPAAFQAGLGLAVHFL